MTADLEVSCEEEYATLQADSQPRVLVLS